MKKLIITLSFSLIYIFSFAQLSGTYTIGKSSAGNYTFNSFSAAVDSLQQVGVSGPVLIKVDTGTYVEKVHINYVNGTSAINTVTFESLNGDSTSVILKYNLLNQSGFVVEIDSANHIQFNELSIIAEGNGYSWDSSGVFKIGLLADSIKISNSILIGGTKGTSNFMVIASKGEWTEISNNIIKNGRVSVIVVDYPNSNLKSKCKIINNQIIDFSEFGIFSISDSLCIESNHIETTWYSAKTIAIRIIWSYFVYIHNNNIVNTNYAIMADDNYDLVVRNNFISIDRPNTRNVAIDIGNMGIIEFQFNSVNMVSGDSNVFISNLWKPWTILKNNIVNIDTGCIYSVNNVYTPVGDSSMDYNIFHLNSGSYIKTLNTSYPTLSSIQTLGFCPNCIDTIPNYTSQSDLHLTNNQFAGLGTANPGAFYILFNSFPIVTKDIDNDLRSMNNLTPGADRFITSGTDIEPIAILYPTDTIMALSIDSIEVVVYNCGTDSIVNYKLKIDIDTLLSAIYTINHTLYSGDIDTVKLAPFPVSYTNTSTPVPNANTSIAVKTIHYQDINPSNDSIFKLVYVYYNDIGIHEIIQPFDTVTNQQSPVIVSFINYGSIAIDSIPINYVYNSIVVNDIIPSILMPMDTIIWTFTQPISNIMLDSVICVNVLLNNDIDTSNNHSCKAFVDTVYIDVGIHEIIQPFDTVTNQQSPVIVSFINYSNIAVDSIPVNYVFNNVVVNDIIPSTMLPMDTINWTFSQQIINTTLDTGICVNALLNNDMNTSNDHSCKTFKNTASIVGYQSKFELEIFPNPADEYVFIKFDRVLKNAIDCEIYDVSGRSIKVKTLLLGKKTFRLDISELENGVYLLKIGDSIVDFKFIVNR